MTKLFTTILFLPIILFACEDNTAITKRHKLAKAASGDTAKNSGIQGIWVRHNKEGFTLIEIRDTSHVSYYQFIDGNAEMETITTDRYWYYQSKATMGYWNRPENSLKANADIWIDTDKFRFDYKLKGDTLIELDKMGEQGKFIKVYNDK